MTFSELLIKKRTDNNLSLREAADKIGISHGYLDKLEKAFDPRTQAANKPTPDTLRLISKAYNVDYYYLMELCGFIDSMENMELDGVYLRLAKEAQEKGLHPDDVRKIIAMYQMFKEQDGE